MGMYANRFLIKKKWVLIRMYSKFCTFTYCECFKVIVIKIFKTISSIEYCIGNGIGWFTTSTTEPLMRERERERERIQH